MRDGEAAAKIAAIANLPIGWLFEDARRERDDLILWATGPDGDEIEISGLNAEEAWRAMAESLASMMGLIRYATIVLPGTGGPRCGCR